MGSDKLVCRRKWLYLLKTLHKNDITDGIFFFNLPCYIFMIIFKYTFNIKFILNAIVYDWLCYFSYS